MAGIVGPVRAGMDKTPIGKVTLDNIVPEAAFTESDINILIRLMVDKYLAALMFFQDGRAVTDQNDDIMTDSSELL